MSNPKTPTFDAFVNIPSIWLGFWGATVGIGIWGLMRHGIYHNVCDVSGPYWFMVSLVTFGAIGGFLYIDRLRMWQDYYDYEPEPEPPPAPRQQDGVPPCIIRLQDGIELRQFTIEQNQPGEVAKLIRRVMQEPNARISKNACVGKLKYDDLVGALRSLEWLASYLSNSAYVLTDSKSRQQEIIDWLALTVTYAEDIPPVQRRVLRGEVIGPEGE